MMRWIHIGTATLLVAMVGVAEAARSHRSHGASHSASQLEQGMYFNQLTHQAIEGARLVDKGDSTLSVLIGKSGQDGVRIRLGHGVTALRIDASVVNADSLPEGAWLEFGSLAGAKDTVGFVRLTQTTSGGFSVRGMLTNAPRRTLVLYDAGTEVYRDVRAMAASDLAHGRGCALCGFSINDDVGRTGAQGSTLLRVAWPGSHTFKVVNRPAGAPDSTVIADEIRILPEEKASGARSLSEFLLRGQSLGELRIRAETATRAAH